MPNRLQNVVALCKYLVLSRFPPTPHPVTNHTCIVGQGGKGGVAGAGAGSLITLYASMLTSLAPAPTTTNEIIFVLKKWEQQLCVNPETLEIMWHGNHLNCLSKENTHWLECWKNQCTCMRVHLLLGCVSVWVYGCEARPIGLLRCTLWIYE